MPGFQLDVQGDEIGVSITILHKSNSDVQKALVELARATREAGDQLVKRLEDKDRVEAHLAFRDAKILGGSDA